VSSGHPETSQGPTPARAALFPVLNAHPVCVMCHEMVDGAGWALQSYDELGRFRQVDADGARVDDSGWLYSQSLDKPEAVSGHRGLARALVDSQEARASLVHWVLDQALASASVPISEREQEVAARCLTMRWDRTGSHSFRELQLLVAAVLVMDWTLPDGGAPGDAAP
jgi:hypothetical protein